MHLVWEGVIPNLVSLWTEDFKGLDEGSGSYRLSPSVFDAVSEAAAASGDHIPSAFSCQIPNLSKDRSYFTAESWSFWALYIGPILLRNRFRREIYYSHFVKLVRILHLCLQFNITTDELEEIRLGLADWVRAYEKLYYQYNLSRLPVCTLTIHGLLHIADSIAAVGPPWVYWAFPTERFCGSLLPAVRSRRHPFSNIDRHVYDLAVLSQLKLVYNLELDLSRRRQKSISGIEASFIASKYKSFDLLCPKSDLLVIGDIRRKVLATLATRFDCDWKNFREVVPRTSPQWGKVRKINGGDLMTAREAIRLHSGERDNSFIRYKLNVDLNARRPRATPLFAPQIFYGHLLRVFQIEIPNLVDLNISAETIVFALIQQCKVIGYDTILKIPYYQQMGATEVVDLRAVQCAIGRVSDRNKWVIGDRRGVLGTVDYVGDEEDEGDDGM
ncbi:hypothetical protein B0J17DRAFT_695263 [Rhizoctonia solani]|nr:hypothetical protein B0J17DRAFT_695263 [Rhizoctonia solani]